MGTITAANFQIYRSATWNVDTPSEGGAISANIIQFDQTLTGTLTFANSTTVTISGDTFTSQIAVGDLIYNSTNDTYTSALRVVSIAANGLTLTLASAYSGTTGSSKSGNKIPKNSIFPDVTDEMRITGGNQYRKIFVYNNNADTVRLKAWFNSKYAASNEFIYMCGGGTATGDVNGDVVTSTGVNGNAWEAPTSITSTGVGTTVVDLGSLGYQSSGWIWLRRYVQAGGNGYINDQFIIGIGMY